MTDADAEHDDRSPAWLEDVRLGKFESLPDPLNWDQATKFIYLLNGYEILKSEKLQAFANRKLRAAEETGIWSGSAKDRWLCLFAENRRWRHFGMWPGRVICALRLADGQLRSRTVCAAAEGTCSCRPSGRDRVSRHGGGRVDADGGQLSGPCHEGAHP